MPSMLLFYHLFLFLILFSMCEANQKSENKCIEKNQISVCPARGKSRDEACSSRNEVMITVSPLIDEQTSKQLQIVWYVEKVVPGDIIRMYQNPDFTSKPVFEVEPTSTYGFSETKIFETFLSVRLKFRAVCMGYWVAYWREDKVLYSSCLQSNPTWMKDYQKFLEKLRLFDMFIPGTHDSAAYHTVYAPEETDENRVEKYVYTQEESILEQLLHGARYLDLRVGRKDEVYYAHHDIARLYPFLEVMNDIKEFLQKTNEILIIDFHGFPIGFATDEDHLKFVDYLYNQLNSIMVSPRMGWTATLDEIWATGRQLIVTYNNEHVVDTNSDILWPPVEQKWGNVQKTDDLYEYLLKVIESEPAGMWSAQAELTAKANNVITNNLGGLRKMATETNTQVTKWFRGDWGKVCHIVAMDFIRASAIVDVAIELNLRRSFIIPCPDEKETVKEVETD